ncbi:MAG: hypothetical protein GY702_20715, partial [Desulfobulbaceae bacterium]|nr:hypothetical protein [Desulfobulbaceae bacterium]
MSGLAAECLVPGRSCRSRVAVLPGARTCSLGNQEDCSTFIGTVKKEDSQTMLDRHHIGKHGLMDECGSATCITSTCFPTVTSHKGTQDEVWRLTKLASSVSLVPQDHRNTPEGHFNENGGVKDLTIEHSLDLESQTWLTEKGKLVSESRTLAGRHDGSREYGISINRNSYAPVNDLTDPQYYTHGTFTQDLQITMDGKMSETPLQK